MSSVESRYAELRRKFFPPTQPIVKAISRPAPKVDWRQQSREFEKRRRREEIVLVFVSGRELTMVEICEQVARKHGLQSWRELKKRSRRKMFVRPRQEAMERCHRETDTSLVAIGRFFGGYDHTTVLHAIDAVEKRRAAAL